MFDIIKFVIEINTKINITFSLKYVNKIYSDLLFDMRIGICIFLFWKKFLIKKYFKYKLLYI